MDRSGRAMGSIQKLNIFMKNLGKECFRVEFGKLVTFLRSERNSWKIKWNKLET